MIARANMTPGTLNVAAVLAVVLALAGTGWVELPDAAGATQQDAFPKTSKLPFRTDRPRLLFTKDQLPAIKKRCDGPYAEEYKAMAAWADEQAKHVLSRAFDEKVRAAAEIKDKYAQARAGSALLAPLETLGLLWHLTGEERYAKAGRRLVVAGFEIASEDFDHAVAYDLFYDVLTPEERLDCGRKMVQYLRSKAGPYMYPELGFHGGRKAKLLISLYGTGIEEAEVNARLAAAYDFAHKKYLATYAQLAKTRGGWNEGFFCGCMSKEMHVPFWWCWQNAAGERIFETNPMFFGMGNWIVYGLMDLSRDPKEWGKHLVPVSSAPFGADKIAQQGLDICAWAARDSVGAWLSKRVHPNQGWKKILLEDPELRTVEPRELPETALFEGWGWVSMRSSWAADGVFAHFTCGPKGQGEPSHLDDNSFVIYRKGLLAIDGFAPANHVGGNFGQMSLAHNTVTVLDPEEKIRGASTYLFNSERSAFAVNDGGQTFWPERREARRVELETASGGYANVRGPSALVWRGRIVAYETGPLYDYVCGDATATYSAAKLRHFTRQFVFLKPDLFVVFDRVASTKKEYRKRWHLQVYEEPAIEGNLVRADHQGGRLWCRTVFPERARLTKVQGAKLERPDGSYERPAAWEKCGSSTWRLDVGPEEAREEEVFLHVLQATEAGASLSFQAETIRRGERIGVRVMRGGRTFEVLFETKGAPAGTVTVSERGKVLAEADLAAEVRDTYAKWKDDPRFQTWMTDERFRYLIPKQDRERFGRNMP